MAAYPNIVQQAFSHAKRTVTYSLLAVVGLRLVGDERAGRYVTFADPAVS
jgi:hypothetical protein